jgi:E3 ubiquitin-protein ligase TRIP12
MHCDAIQMDCNQLVFAGFLVKFTATSVVMLQSLQALKKISQEHPTACLRAGALMAVLSYLDFFSTGVQVFNSLLSVLVNYRHVEML